MPAAEEAAAGGAEGGLATPPISPVSPVTAGIAPDAETLTAREKRAFLIDLARLLHQSGATAGRLEDAVSAAAGNLDVRCEVFSTPTSITIAFGTPPDQRTALLRIQPQDVHLEKLCLVDSVAGAVARGVMSPGEGQEALATIVAAPNRYPTWLITLAFALASGAASVFLGGGASEVLATLVLALAIGVMIDLAAKRPNGAHVVEFVAGVLAAAGALAIDRFAVPIDTYTVTVASIIVLIPGLTLTVAMSELATRHLVSGGARLVGGLMVLVTIGFGVAVGLAVSAALPEPLPRVDSAALPWWSSGPIIVLAGLAFSVLFRARPRDIVFVIASGAIGFSATRGAAATIGPELAPFVGAFAIAAASNIVSRLRDTPAAIMTIPGIILLVPGSIGFRGMAAFLEDQAILGVESLARMLLVAAAIVAGLLTANITIRSRTGV